MDGLILRATSQELGFSCQNNGSVRFADEQDVENEGGGCEDAAEVLDPAPAQMRGYDEAADEGREHEADEDGYGEHRRLEKS